MSNQPNPLLSPAVESKVQEIIKRQQEDDIPGRMAAAQPLPGPTRDAFAIQPDIQVGPFAVRPFYDIDFELLQQLDHPLHRMMTVGISGTKPEANNDYLPRGPEAWAIAWLLTHPPQECEDAFKQGVEFFREQAKSQFSKLQLGALIKINEAILRQLEVYWAPVMNYGPPSTEGENGVPPSSVKP